MTFDDPIPDGFIALPLRATGFSSINGPWYERRDPGGPIFGLKLDERHTNAYHIAHGGLLMAFADICMGRAQHAVTQRGSVTMRMTTDFLAPAYVGEWMEAYPTVSRTTRHLAFVRLEIRTQRRPVMSATGVFSAVRGRLRPGESPDAQ